MTRDILFAPLPVSVWLLIVPAAFLFLAAPPLLAREKGFGDWSWVVPSGLLGFLAVLLLPSARAPGLTDEARAARFRHGRWVGRAQAFVSVLAGAAAIARMVSE